MIGLLIGGVLVGNTLIEAAKFRKGISQIQEYKAAVNTFKMEYNAIPGDFKNAYDMGITQDGAGNYVTCTRHTSQETNRSGNGSGVLNDNNHSSIVYYNGEYGLFWGHLRGAGLFGDIDHIFGSLEGCGFTPGTIAPFAKGPGETIFAFTSGHSVYFILVQENPTHNFANIMNSTFGIPRFPQIPRRGAAL